MGVPVLQWFSFTTLVLIIAKISSGNGEVSSILDKMFRNYDRRVRPYYSEKPVNVFMSAFILDIFGIDEIRQEFTVNMYLRHHWTDPRLEFEVNGGRDRSRSYQSRDGIDRVLVDANHSEKMWIPDTFIVNQRKIEISSDAYNEATMVSHDGSIIRSTKVVVTASCKFDLSYFPFDKQICSLEFKSYAHSASDILYRWKNGIVKLVDISEETTNTRFHISSVMPKEIYLSLHGINISGIEIEFKLERFSSRYLFDIFFPIAILTGLSFLTLFINRSDLSIQISSIILATMTIFIGISMGSIPKVSYQTAVDVYLLFSYIFVCIVVSTNFVLGYLKRANYWGSRSSHRREAVEMEQVSHRDSFRASADTIGDDKFKLGRPNFVTSVADTVGWIFSKRKILLPIMFITFNIVYWIGIAVGSRKDNWEPHFIQDSEY